MARGQKIVVKVPLRALLRDQPFGCPWTTTLPDDSSAPVEGMARSEH
jgi:hypothetical protein